MAFLQILSGPRADELEELHDTASQVVGSADAHILLADDKVAAAHCRVYRAEGRHWLQDLGQASTIVNLRRLSGETVPLEPGDVIILGRTFLRFLPAPPAASAQQARAAHELVERNALLSEQVEGARGLVTDLKRELAARDQELASLRRAAPAGGRDELSTARQRLGQLQVDLEQLRTEKGKVEVALEEREAALERSRKELEASRQKQRELAEQVRAAADDAEARVEAATGEAASILQEREEELRREAQELRERAQQAAREAEVRLKEREEEQRREAQELRERAQEAAREAAARLEAREEELRREAEAMDSRVQEAVHEAGARARALEERLGEALSGLDAARQALAALGVQPPAAPEEPFAGAELVQALEALELDAAARADLARLVTAHVDREALRRFSGPLLVYERPASATARAQELAALRSRAERLEQRLALDLGDDASGSEAMP